MKKNTDMLPIIKFKNIVLRPINESDTDNIVRWRNSESVRKNFIFQKPFTKTLHQSWLNEKVKTGSVIQYIIEINNDGCESVPVGSVYLRDIDFENSCAEYGIFIGEESVLHKGIGSKVAKIFLDFAHKTLGLHRINLRLFADNIPAYKSYRNAGFIAEGIFHDMVKIDGKYRDILFMASLHGDKVPAYEYELVKFTGGGI